MKIEDIQRYDYGWCNTTDIVGMVPDEVGGYVLYTDFIKFVQPLLNDLEAKQELIRSMEVTIEDLREGL